MARSHVLHLRPLSRAGPLRHFPLFTTPPLRPRSPPPLPNCIRHVLAPVGSEYPSPPGSEVRRGIGGEGRGKGRGREAVRAPSRRLRPTVAQGRPWRARPRCAVPSPRPLRREARARPPPAADRVVSSARRASPPSVHIAAAPEPGSPGRPGGWGEGGTGREACQARGGGAS